MTVKLNQSELIRVEMTEFDPVCLPSNLLPPSIDQFPLSSGRGTNPNVGKLVPRGLKDTLCLDICTYFIEFSSLCTS